MVHNVRVMLALGCVSLTALSIPAVSNPNPRGLEQEVRVVIPRDTRIRERAAEPVAAPARQQRFSRPPAAARLSADRYPHLDRAPASSRASKPLFGWPRLISEARKYIGTNPTDMKRRWCARFLNLVLAKTGYSTTGSDAARSFASYGQRISQPKVGAIAVLSRGRNRNLGHVGVITGLDKRGNPIIISGNHGRRVAESVYPRSRVIAYVMPTTGGPRRPVLGRLAEPPQTPRLAHRQPAAPQPASVARRPVQQPVQQLAARRFAQHGTQAQARSLPPDRTPQSAPRQLGGHDKPAFVAALESGIGRMFASAR